MRDHLRRLLSDQYNVSAAANGEEAFPLALTENPDVVLADVMMPKLDGFGLIQKLRSDSRTRTVSVVLLSARAGEEARSEGIDAGADDYLVKPFSARELLARIAARVRQARIRKAEARLRESLERYRLIFEQAADGIWLADQDGRFISVNPTACAMLGYSREEHLRLTISDITRPGEKAARLRDLKRDLAPGQPITEIWELRRACGTYVRVELSHAFTPDGLWQAIGRDIAERERARLREAEHRARLEQEVASRTSELELRIAERDALLNEVHHRVKNNLHVIMSLLEMQARRTDDFAAFRQLEEAGNRVMSIARIHEMLYQSGSLSGVDLTAYASRLVPQLVAFYNVQDRIEVAVKGENAIVDLERAVPCGLLLNELVSNTCKHGFPDGRRGRLTVRLAHENEQIRLTVQDTGIGLPAGFEIAHSDSLGLTIVRLLTDQLGGSVSFRNGSGTCVEVQFPASK
jgi:PAS domain S-box-containing protein